MPGGRVLAFPHERPEPGGAPPVAVSAQSLDQVQFEPLRAIAADAIAQGESVGLLVGTSEEGARVETLLLTPSGRAAQSTGTWVHDGLWNGEQLQTLKGHALDRDAYCFCRACELANGLEFPDEE